MDPNFQGNFQGEYHGGFQGDFQGLEHEIWGGTNASMQPLVPDDNVDWSLWMDLDSMDMGADLGVTDDWGAGSVAADQTSPNNQTFVQHPTPFGAHGKIEQTPTSKHHCASNLDGEQSGIDLDPTDNASGHGAIIAFPNLPFRGFDGGQALASWEPRMASPNQAGQESTSKDNDPRADDTIGSRALVVKPSANKVPNALKAGVRCSHPECKLTFRRKYELQRHENSVHDRKAALFCSVYGCNRIAKALPRKDHFQLHMRKHQNVHLLVCIFDNCRFGPLTQQELLNHLNSQHSQDECCTATEKIWLDYFQWRQTPRRDGSFLFESCYNCPLTFLGCKYRAGGSAFNGHNYRDDNRKHMESHEFIDRSRGFEAIRQIMHQGNWINGLATCPVCQEPVRNFANTIDAFSTHLEQHSKEERISKAKDLAEIFRPSLAGKHGWYGAGNFGFMITAELEEAGVIPKAVK